MIRQFTHPSVADLEAAYEARGSATRKERAVEDQIFSPDTVHTAEEIDLLLDQYRRAKENRASASIRAAQIFMLAKPEVRRAAEWRKFTPGHEDDVGRGLSKGDVR